MLSTLDPPIDVDKNFDTVLTIANQFAGDEWIHGRDQTLYEDGFAAFGELVFRITCRSSNIKGVSSRSRRKSRWDLYNFLNPMRKKPTTRKRRQKSDLEKECDRALVDQIRRLLALPMNKRTHFLRVRHPKGGSHL